MPLLFVNPSQHSAVSVVLFVEWLKYNLLSCQYCGIPLFPTCNIQCSTCIQSVCQHMSTYLWKLTCNITNSHFATIKFQVNIVMLYADIDKSRVRLIRVDDDINKSQFNIVILHVDILFLACRYMSLTCVFLHTL